jgi:hypothetical protein
MAKIFGLSYLIMGFLFGLFISAISLVRTTMLVTQSSVMAKLFGVGAIIFLPIFYGILGVVSGYIAAFIYNWLARRVGGLKLDFEQ